MDSFKVALDVICSSYYPCPDWLLSSTHTVSMLFLYQ